MSENVNQKELIKFGTLPPVEMVGVFEPLAYRYPDTWDIEPTTGPDRMVIAPSAGHCELLLALSDELPGPFGLLYVLLLSRAGDAEPGRYQSPYPVDHEALRAFVREFTPYLEGDGRHHFWIMSLGDNSTLVYDHHNVIYAYGPLERFRHVVESRRLTQSVVRYPVPHAHNYNAPFDAEEDRLLKWWDWRRYPLQPGDE